MTSRFYYFALVPLALAAFSFSVKDEPTLEKLGERLFSDPVLSLDSTISCANCHIPAFAFSDTAKVSRGVGGRMGRRNSPSITNMSARPYFFYDGRAGSLEQQVLMQNPFLKKIFTEADFLYPQPLAISQISFQKKEQVIDHVLLLGDAAGLITPLCGNGMSMALHSSKIAFDNIDLFLSQKINREEMQNRYASQWRQEFSSRLRNGRMIQKLFGKVTLTNFFIKSIKHFPFLIRRMIGATHGKEF